MNSLPLYYTLKHRKLYKFAMFIFISILVFHGTYFRTRPSDVVPAMDWLVFARLLTCSIGFITGFILIPKNVKWGFGSKVLLLYVLATGISAVKSPYPVTVIGYFILLLGASVLMIGLVYHAQNVVQLEKIEKIWFITVSVLIVKDAITSLLFPEMQTVGGVQRLGMGVTHANFLSMLAVLVFWVSFRQVRIKYSALLWLLRAFLIYIIIGAISRVSIAAFLIGGLFFFLFKTREYFKRGIIVFSGVGILLAFFLLSLSFEQEWSNKIVTYTKRGQDKAALTTYTGRTLIWQHALKKSFESPITGHGYGISRLTMGELPTSDARPSHCHNEVLEVFFNTGFLGLIPFLVMLMYSLKWMINYSRLSSLFSTDLALHAVCVIVMLLVSSIFETRLSVRILPTHLLFFLYLLTLDREKHFLNTVKT